MSKQIRLGQVARKLNVGRNTIIEFLHNKGFEIDSNPNTKINEELFSLLESAFQDSAVEKKVASNIKIEGQEILNEIKKNNQSVVFISGHFANFELMAMHLEKTGIELAAIYRPLNNIFINNIMVRIRKKYICKNQIKKGLGGVKKLLGFKKKNFSTALMIDQRVSEGIQSGFFNKKALTTTIPGQLIKKFDIPVVPIHIERISNINFKITINKPIHFSSETSLKEITDKLNIVLEKMVIINPSQWIWSHNRWK